MGTPHLGADVAAWGAFFGIIGNTIAAGAIKADLLKDLKPKSREIANIATTFVSRSTNLQIVSMYECKPTKGVMVRTLW
jgi:hypothetical protein